MNSRKVLEELKRQIDLALMFDESEMVTMNPDEKLQFERELGCFDFVIGDFGITNIKERRQLKQTLELAQGERLMAAHTIHI